MTFQKLAEQIVYSGTLITAGRATFVDPSGATFERDVVHHPGAVVVVPLLPGDRSVLMVRQYRAAIERSLLEIPAGKRDVAGEPVETTARRELAEEVGMVAGRLEKLAEFYNSPGFCDEHSHVFLARDLEPSAPEEAADPGSGSPASAAGSGSIEEQHMTVEEVALDDVARLIASGELTDAKSIIGLCLARLRLGA